jgi:hypothetical protein
MKVKSYAETARQQDATSPPAAMQPEDDDIGAAEQEDAGMWSVTMPDAHQSQRHPGATCDSQRPQTPLPALQETCTLQVICRASGQIVWSKMKCLVGLENGTACCIHTKEMRTKPVLCEDSLMALQVPTLRCRSHDRSFTVTHDPKVWAHVERMEQAGEVFVHPHIVVLSQQVRLTMKAYRSAIKTCCSCLQKCCWCTAQFWVYRTKQQLHAGVSA